MIIPQMMPRTNPHITPGMTLFVTMKSISFSNLLFPISNTVFVLFNSILDRVDHYVRHQPVQFACNLRLQISVHILVVYRGIPFLPLAVPALLHVEEADMDRIAQLDACAVRL